MNILQYKKMSRAAATAMITALAVFVSCATPQQGPMPEVTFAIIGNTSPASPFTGTAEKLEDVYRALNRDNPLFVINTGDIVQGGTEVMGITVKDVERQYRDFVMQKKVLRPIYHVLAGEKDLYNGSLALFGQYTGERLYYSFNYGSIHFILLHIINREHKISKEQMSWLRRDLERHKEDSAIFVFSHYPIMAPPQAGTRFADGEELHKLFVKYPVKATFAGALRSQFELEKDGIKYEVAGCFGYTFEDWHWSYNQYYMVTFDGSKTTVRGVRVNFPGNSYRPKVIKDEPEKK